MTVRKRSGGIAAAVLRSHAVPAGLLGLFLFAAPAAAADILVLDGGTLVVGKRTVRLWGIEAPTATQTCVTTTGRVWPCGARARDELRSAIRDEEVVCRPKARGLDVCRVAGLDIGALLVKEGLARARDDYQELEARARSARAGLWE
ncbi:MAG: thermonuclease family protein [Xanthobacteraceae bacterium]|nr:thermonuclease family protein [Xanthobacteraceae bacterium]